MTVKWSWEGRFDLSTITTVYEIRVAEGRAYIVTGAYGTRFDWFVMDLADVEQGKRGWVQITRAGGVRGECRSSEHFQKGMVPQAARAGYIMEKFPCLTPDEAEEIGLVTLPFLTDIFNVDPRSFKRAAGG